MTQLGWTKHRMTTTTSSSIIERLLQKANRLYTLPAIAMKVVELTSEPKVNAAALRDCVEKDPALTAKILRVVNSSMFGLSRHVNDLNQAVALLGTKPLKLLVLGFSLPDELSSGVEAEVLGQYWRHTLIKAVAARQISEQLFGVPGDDAYLGGLL
jgi:HD-like signal output (HDOD) protein